MGRNYHITKEFLLDEFFEKRKSQKQIAQEVGCHVGTIERHMSNHGLTNQITSRYKVREDRMLETDPYFAYTVGLFITDGSIAKDGRLSIRLNDKDVIKVLCGYFDCPYYFCRKDQPTAQHEFNVPYDTPLTRFCRALSPDITKKTFNIRCPILSTEELNLLLLRGIIDGDGSIRPRMEDFRIFTASSLMTTTLSELLYKLEIDFTSYKTTYGRYQKVGWTFDASGANIIQDLVRIYQSYPELAIQRKRNIVKNKVYDIVRTHEMINHEMWG